jgi:hypothetical protein
MFDEVFGMTALCAENFREGVRDSFGASIVEDVLDPIIKEVDSLRVFNAEFQRQSLSVDGILADARTHEFKDSRCVR